LGLQGRGGHKEQNRFTHGGHSGRLLFRRC
jgi:hypothetical protein